MKGVWFHGVLALLGLSAAYMVWTAKDEANPELGELTLVECRESKLRGVDYEEEGYRVHLEVHARDKSSGGNGRVVWIETKRTPKTGAATSEKFVGGETVDEVFQKLAPLRVLRSLGNVEKKRLKEFELDKPKTKLSLRCGKDSKFVIGGSTYGSGDRYMRAAKGGEVYLLHADVLRDLRSAEYRLMQRQMHRFKRSEVETATVEAFGKQRQLLQRNRLDPQKAEWVDAADPARRNELYGNWLDRLDRLTAQKYLGLKDKPGSDLDAAKQGPVEIVPVLSVSFADPNGDSLGKLELVRIGLAAGPEFYGRSETTAAWVKLPASLAQQVEDDVRAVLGLPADSKNKAAAKAAVPPANASVDPGASAAPPASVAKPPAAGVTKPAAAGAKPAPTSTGEKKGADKGAGGGKGTGGGTGGGKGDGSGGGKGG